MVLGFPQPDITLKMVFPPVKAASDFPNYLIILRALN